MVMKNRFLRVSIRKLWRPAAIVMIIGATSALRAETAPEVAQQEVLQDVLDRVHKHAAGEPWREPGWKDEATEAWLERATTKIAQAVQRPDLTLPVRMADVRPGDAALERTASKLLLVGKNIILPKTRLQNS